MQIPNFDPNKLQIHIYHPHRVSKKTLFWKFCKNKDFHDFLVREIGKMTKNGQKWSFFDFLGPKMGQKIFFSNFPK